VPRLDKSGLERDRARIGGERLGCAIEPLERVGAIGLDAAVVGQRCGELVDRGERAREVAGLLQREEAPEQLGGR
jgi:hypothetical protein